MIEESTDDGAIVDVPERKRPNIDNLSDAVSLINGHPILVPKIGELLIIERFVNYGDVPKWFDTKTYRVESIDSTTGALRLYDVEAKQYAFSNYITGFTNPLLQFKVPTLMVSKRRRRTNVSGKISDQVVVNASARTVKPDRTNGSERTIYTVRGIIHTRIKNIPYGPSGPTRAIPGSRLNVSLSGSEATVTCPKAKWEERWGQISL